jgi:hypothetical protein
LIRRDEAAGSADAAEEESASNPATRLMGADGFAG